MDSDPTRPSRILIVRLSALGDVVHALPLLDALRRAHPGAHIGWLVEDRAASLLVGHPQIDRVWVAPRSEASRLLRRGRLLAAAGVLLRFVRELRAARYALTIDVQSNGRSSALAWASGARRRIGFSSVYAKEWAPWLSTERVSPDRRLHKVARNLELLGPLGVDTRGARPRLAISEAARARARERTASLGRPRVALHPGVSGFGAIKQWEPARFARTARRLAEEHGACCIVTWGPGERELAEGVVAASGGAARLAPRTDSILELAALYELCDLVVGGDTGPLHLAAALGVPVVGLYGPKDPEIYGPWDGRTGQRARAVRRPVHCSPCRRRTCPNVICMPAIQVDDVVAAAREALAESGPAVSGAAGA